MHHPTRRSPHRRAPTDTHGLTRRGFLKTAAAGTTLSQLAWTSRLPGQESGERPPRCPEVNVLNPRARVPLSFIIDDSTCLVNLNRFAIPQFAEAWGGQRYRQDWQSMPAEIPDAFVRKFGEWSAGQGVKGKYSVVPYPACVGRLDRVVPGWTRRQVDQSLELVRKLMMPDWDIHPEMVTHTWVIDTKTGHPYTERSPLFMENWQWSVGKSADELAEYLSYALKILKNVDLACEGVTTPGGFGSRVVPQLARATLESCRDVFRAEIPHYFRHVYSSGERDVSPRVEYASGLAGDDPRCVVSIIACTGDWTGGWDCSDRGDVDRFITADLASGRMVEVIDRGQPAIMLCHWTGIYFNGEEVGFRVFQEAVQRLHRRYDHLAWMKLSEIARYWAARELTAISRGDEAIALRAPFACPAFTLETADPGRPPSLEVSGGARVVLRRVGRRLDLTAGTWCRDRDRMLVCFDLPRGSSRLVFAGAP